MKIFIIIIASLLTSFVSWGQQLSFGQITITPYISDDAGLDVTATKLLNTKLKQIVTENEASGGFDQRFIITPSINILSENETATIPQKNSMKVKITFFIGDGVAGTLFNSHSIEVVGVGDNHNAALYSAIKKISTKDKELQALITTAKIRIVEYYNSNAPILIREAEDFMSARDYEQALSRLAPIPSICKYYDKAQKMISICGEQIIERDNKALLTKAKAAWGANPNEKGAKDASVYLSQVVITSAFYQKEIEALTNQMQRRLVQLDNKRTELARVKILSEERLAAERINASARVTSSFVNTLPRLIFNVLSWF